MTQTHLSMGADGAVKGVCSADVVCSGSDRGGRCFLPMRDSQEAPSPTTAWPAPQVQQERDELYRKFSSAVLEVQQKAGFRSLVLERKLHALSAAVEKKEAQFSEVLAASNLDPAALTLVSRKLEVRPAWAPGGSWAGSLALVGVTCHGGTPACPASITPVETLFLGEGLRPVCTTRVPTLSHWFCSRLRSSRPPP